MNTKLLARTAAAAATLAIAAAFAVSCSQTKQAGSTVAPSATSIASSGASVASSAASAASSAVSSVMAGAPTTLNVPGVGEVALDAATAGKYQQLGGEAALGLPTGQPEKVGNGTAQAFANGTIYSSPSTDAYLVQGEILKTYLTQGGPAGPLGFQTTDESETAGGPNVTNGCWISEFEHGSISWLNQGDGTFKETVTKK